MIDGKKVIGIIPARGGSKGVPRKNIRDLAGKPLIAWTIEQAKKSKYIDRVVLSSEDKEIIKVAERYGCDVPFIRPKSLADDVTPGIEPVLHAISVLPNYDLLVVLQPTSPLRLAEDIDNSIELMISSRAPACVSVTEPDKSPYWMYSIEQHNRLRPLIPQPDLVVRRQDLPKAFVLNGAVYVAKTEWLVKRKNFLTKETIAFFMPKSRSYDIDTEEDFKWCEFLLHN